MSHSLEQPDVHELIYDWNLVDRRGPLGPRRPTLLDETLRDGIQSPSITDPSIDQKIELLRLMDALGVDFADIGLPGAGTRARGDVEALAREIVNSKLSIRPACAARTVVADIEPIVEISQRAGIEIEVLAFIGSSPIRLYAEEWTLDKILARSTEAISFAVRNNLPITYVTEDTIRSNPKVLRPLLSNAIGHGAQRVCLCDTVGHSTPDGVRALIRWTRALIDELGTETEIDWHGHNDRGLGLGNALWAYEFGASRIHGTALGIGERVGNTSMDQLLLNFKLLGAVDQDLSAMRHYVEAASRALHVDIPSRYPVFGEDAFRTATGVHAAAIIKARKKGDAWLADRIYSGVAAADFGKRQEIDVGFMSGVSNVLFWLTEHDVPAEPGLVDRIFAVAKRSSQVLDDVQIFEIIRSWHAETAMPAGT